MPTVHVAEGEPAGCFWPCCATRAQLAVAVALGVKPLPPRIGTMLWEGCVCTSKGRTISPVAFLCVRVIIKATGPGSTQASRGFSLEQLLGKEANPHPEVPCFPWGRCVELSTDSLPTGLLPPCVVFSYKCTF